jgi:5-methyltetrahydrofolate--homocysteine methyltransferase
MAAGAGMTSAIMNPLHAEEMTSIMAADVLNGVDAHCARWIKKYREPTPATVQDGSGQDGAGERPRRQRRRRRG